MQITAKSTGPFGFITSSIADGDTTHAPDGNSVFDALALKAPLISPSFTTPILGTPTSGNLTNCTSDTEADNNSTTQLANTAYAKSQGAVLARLPDPAVNMTYAASGSNGIVVADNNNIDFGTGNFTLVWRGSLPDWTPASTVILLQKWAANVGYELSFRATNNVLQIVINTATCLSSVAPGLVDGTIHEIVIVVSPGTTNTLFDFYIDGIANGVQQTAANPGTVSNGNPLYILGTSATRTAGTCSFAATYNRALTAVEVLGLYRNGIAYADKWGSQTAQTSGTLTIGKRYRIDNWITSDDFTNVGGANIDGTEFIATGTTPTTWTNSSTVYPIGATLALESEGIQNNLWYDSSSNALNASYPAAGWSLTRKLNVPRTNTGQPAFLARPTSTQSNIAIDSAVTVIWGTEIYDQANNFASNTFTAPVTGKYKLDVCLYLLNVDSAATSIHCQLITSNRTYEAAFTPDKLSGDSAYWSLSVSVLADMDAADTAYVTAEQWNGSQQMDISTSSWFSGYLVC